MGREAKEGNWAKERSARRGLGASRGWVLGVVPGHQLIFWGFLGLSGNQHRRRIKYPSPTTRSTVSGSSVFI